MYKKKLAETASDWLLGLATEEGINASGKEETYGCVFGRDSAITYLFILNSLSNSLNISFETLKLTEIVKKGLLTLVNLQGREFNIESGEEPGKFIHEYRKEKFDHLLRGETPWYVYPDGMLRNYDSLDSTPLNLIALHKYYEFTKDGEFLLKILPAVEKGLNWIITYGDRDKDHLLEYEFAKERKHGGLKVQSWTDSNEALKQKDGSMPTYPIAPVEVQGYAWLTLKLWADYYKNSQSTGERVFAGKLNDYAKHMKKQFNEKFIFQDGGLNFAAQALDGSKSRIKTVTGNPLLLLWASYKKSSSAIVSGSSLSLRGKNEMTDEAISKISKNRHIAYAPRDDTEEGIAAPLDKLEACNDNENGNFESILNDEYISDIVKRCFMDDMFDKDAGIRTMSAKSPTFNPGQDSYHNGSFWLKLNGMAAEGLMNWGYVQEAERIAEASFNQINYFGTPIELCTKGADGKLHEFSIEAGQKGCRYQAWTAGAALYLSTIQQKQTV